MPLFERGATTIYYEEHGRGFPLLLLAPGGMLSTVAMWPHAAINPLEVYGDDFRLIAMDQRNAGQSTGPLDVGDPWGSYVGDQLALVDHLGIDTFGVMGCCIGGAFILKLLQRAPARVVAAVLEQPIGIAEGNAVLFDKMWRSWGRGVGAGASRCRPGDGGAVRDADVDRRRLRGQRVQGPRASLQDTNAGVTRYR